MKSRQACRISCQHGAGQAPGGRQRAAARLVAHRAAPRHLVAVFRERLGHVVVQHDAVVHGVLRQRARHGLARAVHRKAVALRARRASRAVTRRARSAAAAVHGTAVLACSFRRSELQLAAGETWFRNTRIGGQSMTCCRRAARHASAPSGASCAGIGVGAGSLLRRDRGRGRESPAQG